MTSSSPSPDSHIAAAKRRLTHLSGIAHRTDASERKILEAAQTRLDQVNADIERLRPRAIADQGAGDAYQQLMIEAGKLATIIAQSQAAIA